MFGKCVTLLWHNVKYEEAGDDKHLSHLPAALKLTSVVVQHKAASTVPKIIFSFVLIHIQNLSLLLDVFIMSCSFILTSAF